MNIASAKAKGRRAAQEVAQALRLALGLEEDDVRVTSSSVTGEDLLLSPAARKLLPFCFEVKNQEALNIWAAYQQAMEHVGSNRDRSPIVAYKRNRSPMMVTMELETWLRHYKP